MEKRLFVQLNGNRKVLGVLRGYDVFLNIVLDDAVEEKPGGERQRLGMVVIRGNSVVMLEVRKLRHVAGGVRLTLTGTRAHGRRQTRRMS